MFNSDFMFADQTKKDFEFFLSSDQEDRNIPHTVSIKNGTVLPLKPGCDGLSWGGGGLLDENGNFVLESKVETGFGAPYQFKRDEVKFVNESVIFIPIIPNHWGHFLINTLCRLWDQNLFHQQMRIVYCGFKWPNGKIDCEKFLEVFEALGIDPNRLLLISKPTQFSQIFLPSETFGYAAKFNSQYFVLAKRIVNAVLSSDRVKRLTPFNKIYFTRCQYLKSKLNEFGEKNIENIFRKNGYVILAPEKLSFYEEVFYFANAKEVACMSGTTPHNAIFMSPEAKLYIINRTSDFNPPQAKIVKYFHLSAYLVDCYCTYLRKHPIRYGEGPFWISPNLNFRKFSKTIGLKIPLSEKLKIPFSCIANFLKFYLFLYILRPLYKHFVTKRRA